MNPEKWLAGAELYVQGPPIPWAAAHNPRGGGKIIPHRQATQAARILMAFQELGLPCLEKPTGVVMQATFFVARPKTHYGSGRNARVLKDSAPAEPTGRPDLSNLMKLVEDALTGHAYDDDDQVVRWEDARKLYVHSWERPGTRLRLWRSDRAAARHQLSLRAVEDGKPYEPVPVPLDADFY